MSTIEEKLEHEINWRVSEISIIKSIPYLYPLSDDQKDTLIKHTIPVFYSLWEGFVADCFEVYAHEINLLKISALNIGIPILTHTIDTCLSLQNPRIEFDQKSKLINEIQNYLNSEINIPVQIPTESNVSFKVINRILTRFNLVELPERPYKTWLNDLLFFRNKLSHGELSIIIDQKRIDKMSYIVISSCHILAERVIEGFNSKSYLR